MYQVKSSDRDMSKIQGSMKNIKNAEKDKFNGRYEFEQNRPGIGITRQEAERRQEAAQKEASEKLAGKNSDGRITREELKYRKATGQKSSAEIAFEELIKAGEDMKAQEEKRRRLVGEAVAVVRQAQRKSASIRKSTS